MKIKRSFLLVLMFIPTTTQIIDAMEYIEDAYVEAKKHIILPQELSITELKAYQISEQATQAAPLGCLILVKADDKEYHYAIVKSPSWANRDYISIFDCHEGILTVYHTQDTRRLKLITQAKYQPYPPTYVLQSFFTELSTLLKNTITTHKKEILLQGRIIPEKAHIHPIGDMHGNTKALTKILRRLYRRNILDKNGILEPNHFIIFTGDITDRGPYGPHVWHTILQLKKQNPHALFITRGNHESLEAAYSNDFLSQILSHTCLERETAIQLLVDLFASLPHGLILGVAPHEQQADTQDPYNFLLLCHGGNDPIIQLKRFMQEMVETHKKTGAEEFSRLLPHPKPKNSGLLWTDFRANRYANEPATREPSLRAPYLHLLNRSAALDFFDEHRSAHPRHPYILDAIIRGHQHLQCGIGRLNEYESTVEDTDWIVLEDNKSEIINPSSVYTCISSTKYAIESATDTTSYLDIEFQAQERTWLLTPRIESRPRKTSPV